MKILPTNIAVIEGDSHHAAWVQECGKLVHDPWFANWVCSYTKKGMCVVDGGANIGTITSLLLECGTNVHAFEPNPEAAECLSYNCPTAVVHMAGLSDTRTRAEMRLNQNAGASHVELAKEGAVQLVTLDSFNLAPGLIKLDVEGFETKALQGARKTIAAHRPTLICEVNSGALERAGSSDVELVTLIESMGYKWEIIQPDCRFGDPQFDIVCLPIS